LGTACEVERQDDTQSKPDDCLAIIPPGPSDESVDLLAEETHRSTKHPPVTSVGAWPECLGKKIKPDNQHREHEQEVKELVHWTLRPNVWESYPIRKFNKFKSSDGSRIG